MDLDAYLGVHTAALKLRQSRTEVLANNLANADTPGFKARDIDFKGAMNAAMATQGTPGALAAPSAGTAIGTAIGTATGAATETGGTEAFLRYRTPLAPSLDGNTVDVQLEQASFAENAVRYQATLSFLSGKFRSLMTAITGQ